MLENKHIMIAPLGLVGLTILSGAFLMSSVVSADDSAVDNVNITVPVSCSMEGTGMNTHNANIVNGTYQADIGTTTMKAYCNDSEGFAIYANGYTGDTLGNNKLIGSSTNEEIVTGTATSTPNPDISNWAMRLSIISSPTPTYPLTIDSDTNGSFTSYHIIPSTYTKVAHRDSGTDIGTSAEGSTLTSTYAAYISKTQPADSYVGQVIYTLVHPASEEPLQPRPATAGCINYFANASTSIGEMRCQPATNNANVYLWAPNFKRTGYGFSGWNDKFDYSGNFYGPNQTITAPADVETNGLSLYAVWIKSAGSLQNWNGCSGLAQGATTALTDERDGNTYAVAKLADNKCWMIENLRLADKDSSNNDINLSSANTHNPSLPITNIYDTTNPITSNHLSTPVDSTQTAWCISQNSSACIDQSMLDTSNTTLFINNTSTNYRASSNVYSYGNYYNWYSATAGHGKHGSSYASGYTAPGDICPAGWHLPTGKDATGDFGVLDVAMGGTGTDAGAVQAAKWYSYPNNFVDSGYLIGSPANTRNLYGGYWSSSAGSDYNAYSLLIYAGYFVRPGTYHSNGNSKSDGRMVRCVAGVRQ